MPPRPRGRRPARDAGPALNSRYAREDLDETPGTRSSHRAEAEPHISFGEFAAACAQHGMTEDDAAELAELLNDRGLITYLGDDEVLAELVVLNPEWLSKAIGHVMEDEDGAIRVARGVLDHQRLGQIWRDRPGEPAYSRRLYPYFLRVMEKFEASFRLEDGAHSLIAQLVPDRRPKLPWQFGTTVADGMRRLQLIYVLSGAVPGLIPALTVRMSTADIGLRWRNGIFLRHPNSSYGSEALIELRATDEIWLEVRASSPDFYLHVLRDSLKHLAKRWKGLTYQQYIPCPRPSRAPCTGRFDLARLLDAREQGSVATVECPVCSSRSHVTELLTGFPDPPAHPHEEHLSSLAAQLRDIARGMGDIGTGVRGIQASAAENAYAMRRLLAVANTEIVDCPHLFTLARVPHRGLAKAKVHQHQYRLTLWCEQPGNWHPCREGVYNFHRDAEWLRQISVYAKPILSILRRVVPLAATFADMTLTKEQLVHANREIELMQALIAVLPDQPNSLDDAPASSDVTPAVASGGDLRGVRQLLHELDPYGKYGGLRRVQAMSGEYLWICVTHMGEYILVSQPSNKFKTP